MRPVKSDITTLSKTVGAFVVHREKSSPSGGPRQIASSRSFVDDLGAPRSERSVADRPKRFIACTGRNDRIEMEDRDACATNRYDLDRSEAATSRSAAANARADSASS